MTWLMQHTTQILFVWGVIWALSTALQNVFPPGSALFKACHVVLALSPLDFVKAMKQLGLALVPPLAVMLLVGCGGSQTTPQTPQNAAFDAVATAADAWGLAATTCLDLAGANKDGSAYNAALAHECRVVLAPVEDSITAAMTAATIWDDAAQANYACLMGQVGRGLTQAVQLFHLPQSVADAATVAGQFGARCHDAG
jgi:hypothetical protein